MLLKLFLVFPILVYAYWHQQLGLLSEWTRTRDKLMLLLAWKESRN